MKTVRLPMTPLERAERIADRILAKHYRGPQDSQGFVDLRPELRAGIVEELLPLLKPDRAKASAS